MSLIPSIYASVKDLEKSARQKEQLQKSTKTMDEYLGQLFPKLKKMKVRDHQSIFWSKALLLVDIEGELSELEEISCFSGFE